MSEPSTAGASGVASVPRDQPLAIQGLRAGYGAGDVVNGVNLFVGEGELVALLGPNGAGKSTLLRAVAGYLKPTAGTVYLFGEPATDPPYKRVRRGLGYLGEGRHVFPGLTVGQNLRLVRGGRAEVLRRFPQLEPRVRVRAGFISGGEQQMLSLGRALAANPRVLVVDELSIGLAPIVRDNLFAMLRQVADRGVAVFVVEQSVKSALEWADRAYVLRRGEIIDHRPAADWRADLDAIASLFLS